MCEGKKEGNEKKEDCRAGIKKGIEGNRIGRGRDSKQKMTRNLQNEKRRGGRRKEENMNREWRRKEERERK